MKKEKLTYHEAMVAIDEGKKVKLPEWDGYWFKNPQLELEGKAFNSPILVMDRHGEVLGTPYYEAYQGRMDWQITDGARDFGGALTALKAGKLLQRKGWNGKGMFIFLRPGDLINITTVIENVKSLPNYLKEYYKLQDERRDGSEQGLTNIAFTPYLCMKAADGSVVNGWLASQTDMLAEDWYIVDVDWSGNNPTLIKEV